MVFFCCAKTVNYHIVLNMKVKKSVLLKLRHLKKKKEKKKRLF